jgi:hypothetical protein
MGFQLSALKARISNRLARDFLGTPLHLPSDQPMVSFTIDDVPESAATVAHRCSRTMAVAAPSMCPAGW